MSSEECSLKFYSDITSDIADKSSSLICSDLTLLYNIIVSSATYSAGAYIYNIPNWC